jgi:glutaredoxin
MDVQRPSDLALYVMRGCGYCADVREAATELGVVLEERDTSADAEHLRELMAARGRRTVPVLRIAREGREDEWMPESKDIIRYLEERFGEGRRTSVATRKRLRLATIVVGLAALALGGFGVVPYWIALPALAGALMVGLRVARR